MLQFNGRIAVLGSLLCCLLVATIVWPTTAVPQARAAGATVNAWLTTTDGANKLSPQPSLNFGPASTGSNPIIDVNDSQTSQQMVGFGAAVTDSSAWLIYNKMSTTQRNTLMSQLFDPTNGIGVNFVRLPMGASDFSVNGPYSYDDLPQGQTDPNLSSFSTAHDSAYIIPVLKQALQLNSNLKFMANPWSAPAWMKTNGTMLGNPSGTPGTLISSDYQPLANYFVKFIQSYQGQGLPVYAVTPQNEPLYTPGNYPGMSFPASNETSFIKNNLGPALASANLQTKILAYDHNWDVTSFPQTVLSDASAYNYTSGIAWHCYGGDPSSMTTIHNQYPNKDVYETECSTGVGPNGTAAPISTIDLLMRSTQNWAKTVELWNIALDPNGNPHSGGCGNCVGIVSIDQSTGNVTYTDDYYQLGHFSKFVAPGSYHIASNNVGSVEDSAFKNPDGSKVLVLHNGGSGSSGVTVRWDTTQTFDYTLPAGATVTFSWAGTATGLSAGYAINSGGGAVGNFSADGYFSGGQPATSTASVDTSAVTNPAPQAVYQSERYGNFTYTLPQLVPGASYRVRLHFNELYWSSSGKRIFNVSINGNQVLSNFDIFAAAGGENKATVKEFTATASSSGQLVIQYSTVVDNAKSSGIEVIPLGYAINSGGSSAGNFLADEFVNGGTTSTSPTGVDTSGVTNPAPQTVYQSERYGNFTYTLPGLKAGASYKVRLHFVEYYWSSSGQRLFNVTLNGNQVLTNFDIYAAAGAQNKAVIQEFNTTADNSGQITIQYTTVVDNAKASGIEIIAS